MIDTARKIYRKQRSFYHRMKFYFSINWTKTLYFNFKMFPFSTAVKFPVYFYGRVKFSSLKGKIEIDAPIKSGMIGFGQTYEMTTVSKGTAEIFLAGTVIFRGHVQFGKDYFVYVAPSAVFSMGHMASLASNGKIICVHSIYMGDWARIGSESQVIDTNFHQMINTQTGERYPVTGSVMIGSYNYIGNRVSVMQGANTPSFCTIASNSLCNKDFSDSGENILIGGIPAKLLQTNISRDWEGEQEALNSFLLV
ncbi:acyltransferase [Flavobacterium pedocola]